MVIDCSRGQYRVNTCEWFRQAVAEHRPFSEPTFSPHLIWTTIPSSQLPQSVKMKIVYIGVRALIVFISVFDSTDLILLLDLTKCPATRCGALR
jgi:hypothetical protein